MDNQDVIANDARGPAAKERTVAERAAYEDHILEDVQLEKMQDENHILEQNQQEKEAEEERVQSSLEHYFVCMDHSPYAIELEARPNVNRVWTSSYHSVPWR